jgi:hypothetical protein
MNEAIYGVFANIEDAERAISALKDHHAGGNEISVLQKHSGAGLPASSAKRQPASPRPARAT